MNWHNTLFNGRIQVRAVYIKILEKENSKGELCNKG
jgi:hypothetical protein